MKSIGRDPVQSDYHARFNENGVLTPVTVSMGQGDTPSWTDGAVGAAAPELGIVTLDLRTNAHDVIAQATMTYPEARRLAERLCALINAGQDIADTPLRLKVKERSC